MFLEILLGIITLLVFYVKWSFNYWKRKNVEFPPPSFPFGNMENPFARILSVGALMKTFYDEYKAKGCKHLGLYNLTSPIYMLIAPEYVKHILQNDFRHFVDRGDYFNEKGDPLSANLFYIGGEKWKYLRAKLAPTFTPSNMKRMFGILLKSSEQMHVVVDRFAEANRAIDIKEVLARFTTDIIGSCAFGLECNSFTHPNAEFRRHGKIMFSPPASKLTTIKLLLANCNHGIGHFLGIKLFPKDSTDFFLGAIRETLVHREKTQLRRNDMLQILMDLKNEGSLTLEEVAAQALIFFLGGFETSSATMTFCLFELSLHQKIQDKVRSEINSVLTRHDGELTYECLEEMKYLKQIFEETMRKYPALSFINRRCVEDWKDPNTNLTIERGTLISIPILGLHYDEDYFPEPEKFDPERFSEKNKSRIPAFTYLPFGEGPRYCIGTRFGYMQDMVGLTTLLKNYVFTIDAKTEIPLKIDPYTIVSSTTKPIWLNARKMQ